VQEPSQREGELAKAIMAYLAEHPEAMDTLEGIAEWWVLRQQGRVELDSLNRALLRLKAEGLLEAEGKGQLARYRLKKSDSDHKKVDGA